MYARYAADIRAHALGIDRLAKTETLGESPESYRQKVKQGKRNPAAAFELALKSPRPYHAGDQISYYVTGTAKNPAAYEHCRPVSEYDPAHPDENVAHYLEKLRQLKLKFAPFMAREPTLFDC